MTDQVKEFFDILMCNYDFSAVFAKGLVEFLADADYERLSTWQLEISRFDQTGIL